MGGCTGTPRVKGTSNKFEFTLGLGPRNLGSKTPLNEPHFRTKIEPKLEVWFLGGVFSLVKTAKI